MEFPVDLLKDIFNNKDRLDEMQRHTHQTATHIEYVDQPITYAQFLSSFLLPNRCCILGPWATKSWRAREDWCMADNTPNLSFLAEHFGGAVAPVADCDAEKYSSHPKEDMTVAEFVEYLNQTQSNESHKTLYLKDWHFQKAFPEYEAYRTPVYFQSDWLNEYWDTKDTTDSVGGCTDDYRFVYVGPRGSWTPFHADVLRSYSWSANICGHKKWLLYPPGEEQQRADRLGNLPFDLRAAPPPPPTCRQLEVHQLTGEVIFVPSGWHHQVFNVEDTISINHNWFGGAAVGLVWDHLRSGLGAVQREIMDCRDMEGWQQQCQLILRASNGMDYKDLFEMLQLIGHHRLSRLHRNNITMETISENNTANEIANNINADTDRTIESDSENIELDILLKPELPFSMSPGEASHLTFDLLQIARVLESLKQTDEWTEVTEATRRVKLEELLANIQNVVEKVIDAL